MITSELLKIFQDLIKLLAMKISLTKITQTQTLTIFTVIEYDEFLPGIFCDHSQDNLV